MLEERTGTVPKTQSNAASVKATIASIVSASLARVIDLPANNLYTQAAEKLKTFIDYIKKNNEIMGPAKRSMKKGYKVDSVFDPTPLMLLDKAENEQKAAANGFYNEQLALLQ